MRFCSREFDDEIFLPPKLNVFAVDVLTCLLHGFMVIDAFNDLWWSSDVRAQLS